MVKNKSDVLIVGSGLGGLSAALRLASKGYKVKILEKHSTAGGRLNRFSKNGYTFDTGPSFMCMTYEFDELFRDCNLDNPLKLKELDLLYRVFYGSSGKVYDIWKDMNKLAKVFAEIEPDFLKKANSYLDRAGDFYFDTEKQVVKNNFANLFDYLQKISRVPIKHIPYLKKNLWKLLNETFESDEVKVIFSLVSFFLGSTPFKTPSIYSLLNFTEFRHDGYWHIKGGMYTIVEEILKHLNNLGVEIIYNTEISGVANSNGVLNSLTDKTGKEWKADRFIINSDAASFRGLVLNRKKFSISRLDKMKWSLAPLTIYLGVNTKIPNLYYHNYFLGNNFAEYAGSLFTSDTLPSKPYYYVNVPSYYDETSAPAGCENVFILCPSPDLRYKKEWKDKENIADSIIGDMSERINFDIKEHIEVKEIYSPSDWQNMFNLYRGSGLGLSHDMLQVGAFRPSNKDEIFPNLFYVGASTTPGTGLPMVLISSKLVTERMINEL